MGRAQSSSNKTTEPGQALGCDPGTVTVHSVSFCSSNWIHSLHAAFRQAGELQGVEGRSCQGEKKKP